MLHLCWCVPWGQVIIGNCEIESTLSGTTAIIGIIEGSRLLCYNVGDSRLIIGRQSAETGMLVAEDVSNDHKPDDPAEKHRIEQNGGRVEKRIYDDGYIGPARVFLKARRPTCKCYDR